MKSKKIISINLFKKKISLKEKFKKFKKKNPVKFIWDGPRGKEIW